MKRLTFLCAAISLFFSSCSSGQIPDLTRTPSLGTTMLPTLAATLTSTNTPALTRTKTPTLTSTPTQTPTASAEAITETPIAVLPQLIEKTAIAGQGAYALAYSPDNTRLAALNWGTTGVTLYDLQSGQPQWVFNLPADQWGTALAFQPSGDAVAVGGSLFGADTNAMIYLLDAKTGDLRQTVTGFGMVTFLGFTYDSRFLIIGGSGENYGLMTFDLVTNESKFEDGIFVNGLDVAPDRPLIAVAENNPPLWLVDPSTLSAHLLGLEKPEAVSLHFTADGTGLYAWLFDGYLRLWNIANDREIPLVDNTLWQQADDVVFSSRDSLAALTLNRTVITVWDISSGQVLATADRGNTETRSVTFSPDGVHLATGETDRIHVWQLP